MITGALILAVGILAGWLLRSLPGRRKDPKAVPQLKPLCGCTHHHSFHDPAGGTCHGKVEIATHWNTYGEERMWRQDPCTCKQYSGPVPLPEYFAPEIAGEAGQ